MTAKPLTFDAAHGELLIRTGVTGRAAKMGHRLTLAMQTWQATVAMSGDRPSAVELTIEVNSLRVLRGEGGLTPLSTPEKALIRGNALKCLRANEHPLIQFRSNEIEPTADGYRLTGELTIAGRTNPHLISVQIGRNGESLQVTGSSMVCHSDFGVRRYSMALGAMQVADEVEISLSANVAHDLDPDVS